MESKQAKKSTQAPALWQPTWQQTKWITGFHFNAVSHTIIILLTKKKKCFFSLFLICWFGWRWMPDVDIVTHMRVSVSMSFLHVCRCVFFFFFPISNVSKLTIEYCTNQNHLYPWRDTFQTHFCLAKQSRHTYTQKTKRFNGIFAYAICAISLPGICVVRCALSSAHIHFHVFPTKEMH